VLHASVAALAVLTRRRPNAQLALFLALCGVVYAAQYLNAYARPRWRELGFTQNYFDSRGVFISFLFSLPLLAICLGQMVGGPLAPSVGALARVSRRCLVEPLSRTLPARLPGRFLLRRSCTRSSPL
jgi:hypothetical protein